MISAASWPKLARSVQLSIRFAYLPEQDILPSVTYIPKFAEFILGDMRDKNQVVKAVAGMDVIFHLAAAVGVGQSMYQIADYTATNNLGTANLFQAVLDTRSEPEKIVVASSMSIY